MGSAGIRSRCDRRGGQGRAVTLTWRVSTYGEKLASARAASRVYGVKAVADDLQVRLLGQPRDDSDVAQAIAHVLEWNTNIPEGKVQARVQAGWVTLDGEVTWDYQRHEVERMVRHVRGVVGITNNIVVMPPVSPALVEAEIEEAFKGEAEVDARQAVTARRLKGNARSWRPSGAEPRLGEDALEFGQAGPEDPGSDPVGYRAGVARGVEGR